MNQSAAISVHDLVVKSELVADYYRLIRQEVFARGENENLRALLPQVEKDPVRQATLRALLNERIEAQRLLSSAPRTIAGDGMRGLMLLEEGRTGQARKLLEESYAKFHDPYLGQLLVEARAFTGEVESARKLYGTLSAKLEAGAAAFLEGVLREREGDYPEAIAAYEKAVEIQPTETIYHFRLGYLASLHGDIERAIQAYETCQGGSPVFVRAMINLGILYEDEERYDEAIICYQLVVSAYPDHPRAKMYLADAEASVDMYYDREKEKERSRRNQLLGIPITDFELSVRSRNCLQKMNIHTLGDLIKKSEAELLSYKNFGETSLMEIKRNLAAKGFRLGQDLDDDRKRQATIPDSEQEKLLGEPVSVLELSSRSQRCMDRLGIEMLGQLVKRTELELISQKNFGVTSLNEIKRKLKERGLSLASG
ncbi:MAG: DNA-directed RNA polymerase subunit alpha C-terminal domain-containing protein [Planctomycetota bacterium]